MVKVVTSSGKWSTTGALVLVLAAMLAQLCFALDGVEELIVTASFSGQDSVAKDEPIELRWNRQLLKTEGRIAVIIGTTDVTSLFTYFEQGTKYRPPVLPLAAGKSELIVYLVSQEDEWKEVGRFALNVREEIQTTVSDANSLQPQAASVTKRRFGFDKLEVTPALNLGVKSQVFETHFPEANRPERPTFVDVTISGAWKSEMTRGRMSMQQQFDIVGSSAQNEALRFDKLGTEAPRVDLSGYLMQFDAGKIKFSAGHSTFGSHRQLINNFASRGLTATIPLGSRIDFNLIAMNSTSIVGWENFFGLVNRQHRLFGGVAGIELLKRPGGLRIEGGFIDAWFQAARQNFNQSNVNDAERSRGASARVLFKDNSERIRFDAGITRSIFVNPPDPLLVQGIDNGDGRDIVPSRQVRRNARYLDASLDLFRDFSFGPAKSLSANTGDASQKVSSVENSVPPLEPKKFSLTLNLRHERVAPLFKSIAATTQADLFQNQMEMVGRFGEMNFSAGFTRSNDNLGGIQTILRTNTERSVFAFNTPSQGLLSSKLSRVPNPFMPRIGFTREYVRARADFIPIGGGFDQPGSIPDLATTRQTVTAEWQFKEMRIAYALDDSLQDNRAPGRERADFRNTAHNASFGWRPRPTFEINLDLSSESGINREQNQKNRTLRLAFQTNWQATSRQNITSNFSSINGSDIPLANSNRNIELNVQWNYRLTNESESRFRKRQTSLFVRYSNRFARTRSSLEDIRNLTRLQTFNTGLNFIFF